MNWEAIGAVGELLGAILLLVSFIYLGVQVRETRKQMSLAGAQARADSLRELFALRMKKEFIVAEIKAESDPSQLSKEEARLLDYWFFAFLVLRQNNFYQRQVGILDKNQSGALDEMPLITKSDFYMGRWAAAKRQTGASFSPEFIAHVDGLIARRNT